MVRGSLLFGSLLFLVARCPGDVWHYYELKVINKRTAAVTITWKPAERFKDEKSDTITSQSTKTILLGTTGKQGSKLSEVVDYLRVSEESTIIGEYIGVALESIPRSGDPANEFSLAVD